MNESSIDQFEKPDLFHFRYLGKVQVKGKQEPIGLYECFDGDPRESFHAKPESHLAFEEGLNLFFTRDFAEAANSFSEIFKSNPHDATARLFMNKASQYLLNGVDEGWTGVEVMERK